MRWTPANLPQQLIDLANAIDRQFAPRFPSNPPRLPAIAQADLTDAFAKLNPYGQAVNTDTGKVVVSRLVAGDFVWRNVDGTAL
jgi:hypothetical protein